MEFLDLFNFEKNPMKNFSIPFLLLFSFIHTLLYSNDINEQRIRENLRGRTRFVENKGQVYNEYYQRRNDIIFYTHAAKSPLKIYFRRDGWNYQVERYESFYIDDPTGSLTEDERMRTRVHYALTEVDLVNCNTSCKIYGLNEWEMKEAFIQDIEIYDVRSFSGIMYENIYPGIDLIFKEVNNEVKYEFVVHPGADIRNIQLRFKGHIPTVDNNGISYKIENSIATIREDSLFAFTQKSLKSVTNHVPIKYVIEEDILRFEIPDDYVTRIKHETLIIDPPVRVWGAYFGGNATDRFNDMKYHTYNGTNYLIIVGDVTSANIAVTGNAYQGAYTNGGDGIILYVDPITSNVLYATYFGAPSYDILVGVDAFQDRVAVIGRTDGNQTAVYSTPGAHQTFFTSGNIDSYIQVFDLINHTRIWGSIIDPRSNSGGNNNDRVNDVIFDPAGMLYVTGRANPMRNPPEPVMYFAKPGYTAWRNRTTNSSAGEDAFLIKFNTTNGQGLFGTFIGVYNVAQNGLGLACVDDKVYVLYTTGTITTNIQAKVDSMATAGRFDNTYNGSTELVICAFDSVGNYLWGTLLGGSGNEDAFQNNSIHIITSSQFMQPFIAVSGTSTSIDYPLLNPIQTTNQGNSDAVITFMDTSGTNLLFSTYWGGSLTESLPSLIVDTLSKRIYFSCTSNSSNMPTSTTSHQPIWGGLNDGYIGCFNLNYNLQATFNWGTYYGGLADDDIRTIAIDTLGNLYVNGTSNTAEYTPSPFNAISTINTYNLGTSDGFYARFCVGGNPDLPVVVNLTPNPICQYDTLVLSANYTLGYGNFSNLFWRGPNPYTSINANDTIFNVNYPNAGVYSLYVQNNLGEVGCDAKVLTVNYTPIPSVTSSPNSPVCELNDVYLNSGEPGHAFYQWIGPNGYTSTDEVPLLNSVTYPVHDGDYTVTVTTLQGCTGSGTMYLNVIDSANMYLSIDPIPGDSICKGSTFDLQVINGGSTSFVWSEPSFPNQSFVTGIVSNATTTYTVTVTDPAYCNGTASTYVTVYSLDPTAANVVLNVSPPQICFGSGDSVSVWVTGGDPNNSSYFWSDPTIYGDSGRVYYSTSQPIIVTVNNPLLCAGSLTVSEYIQVVNNVSLAAFSNAPICEGNTLSIQVVTDGTPTIQLPDQSTVGGFSYVVSNAQLANSGTYRIFAINQFGCKDSVDITVVVSDQAPVVYNSGPVCNGGTLQLFSGYGTSYSWTGPNGFTSNQQNPIINNVSPANAGVYTVVVSGSGNCTGTGTTTVYVDYGLVDAQINILTGNNPVCDQQGVLLYANTGGNYQWSNGATTQSIWINNPGVNNITQQSYSVTITDISGCTNAQQFATTQLTFMPTIPSQITGNTLVCENDSILISHVPNSPPFDQYSFTYYLANGTTSTLNPVIIPIANPATDEGWYVLQITDSSGCMGYDSLYVDVTNFNSSLYVTGNTCVGSSFNITANPAQNVSWLIPGGGVSTNNPLQISNATPANAGTYIAAVTDTNQCKDTLVVYISISQININALSNNPVCTNDTIKLDVSPANLMSYTWQGPNGFSSNQTSPVILNANSIHAGIYQVVALDSLGCVDTAIVMVSLFPSITPYLFNDLDSTMQNQLVSINIIVNDSNIINSSIQIIQGPFNGTYSITNGIIQYTPNSGFYGTDSIQYVNCDPLCILNCDTAWVKIIVKRKGINVNQLITPNDDGNNDTWVIDGIENYPDNKVIIMNRWGDEIFRANPYQNNWSGQSNTGMVIGGGKVTSGVYFYIIDLGNGDPVYKGFVVLE